MLRSLVLGGSLLRLVDSRLPASLRTFGRTGGVDGPARWDRITLSHMPGDTGGIEIDTVRRRGVNLDRFALRVHEQGFAHAPVTFPNAPGRRTPNPARISARIMIRLRVKKSAWLSEAST